MFKDYYMILEISFEATSDEIKAAYRKQAIRWHPDKNLGVNTTIQMQEICEAYLILKDPESKILYDKEYVKFKLYKQQFNSSSYTVEDPLLKKWMNTAYKQSINIAKETMALTKTGFQAAGNEALKQIVPFIIISIIMFICYHLFH